MTYFELLSTEKDYYNKLTDDERKIYRASHEQLSAIDTWNDFHVRSFVEISRQMLELHRLHHRYNEIVDYVYDKPNMTEEQQKHFDNMYTVNDEAFKMNMSIGSHSAVFFLGCMDECDALYEYLAKVKMNRFDWLCDNFDISVLIETLVSHECY